MARQMEMQEDFPHYLDSTLSRVHRILTACGFGDAPPTWKTFLKVLYALFTLSSIGHIVYLLVHDFLLIDYASPKFDFATADSVLAIVYELEALLCAVFLVYKARTRQFRTLSNRWTEFEADALISRTNYSRAKWLYYVPLFVFFLFAIGFATMDLIFDLLGPDTSAYLGGVATRRRIEPTWHNLMVVIPAKLLATTAWIGAYFLFFAVCLLLSYAWRGFVLELQKTDEPSHSSIVEESEERVRFVSDTHMQLTQLTRTVSETFGPYAAFMIVLSIPDLFLHLYYASHTPPNEIVHWIGMCSFVVSTVSICLLFLGSLVNIEASAISDAFYDRYYAEMKRNGARRATSEKSLLEASILMAKLYNTKIYVWAAGFFAISGQTLGMIFSMLGTAYFVFLMDQGKPGAPVGANSTVVKSTVSG